MNGISHLQRHLLRRGLRIWMLVRAIFAIALLMTLNPPLPVGGAIGLGVVVVTAALCFVDARLVKETVFLANLGLRLPSLLASFAVVPILGEMLLALIFASPRA
jgi:hypothetical protein